MATRVTAAQIGTQAADEIWGSSEYRTGRGRDFVRGKANNHVASLGP